MWFMRFSVLNIIRDFGCFVNAFSLKFCPSEDCHLNICRRLQIDHSAAFWRHRGRIETIYLTHKSTTIRFRVLPRNRFPILYLLFTRGTSRFVCSCSTGACRIVYFCFTTLKTSFSKMILYTVSLLIALPDTVSYSVFTDAA